MSRGYFSIFGAQVAIGRLFVEEDIGRLPVGVLSHAAWQILGGSADVVGSVLRWGGAHLEVVGVLPPSFEPTAAMTLPAALRPGRSTAADRSHHYRSPPIRLVRRAAGDSDT